MPVYEYIAINQTGRKIRGSIDADNVRVARQRLRKDGIFPTTIDEATGASRAASKDILKYLQTDRVAGKDLAVATRQLATLVNAGLPLVSALNALAEQTDSAALKRILIRVREDVEEGLSLAKALGKYPKAFPRLYVSLVASGEASGRLDDVLEKLSDHMERQMELRRKIGSALLYPILMLFVCSAVVIGLVAFVIPRIVEIFRKQGADLPIPTQIMIGISDLLLNYWYLIILAIIVGSILFRWYYRQAHGRARVDRILLKLPIFGNLYAKVIAARVATTLGTLVGSGVGLLRALDITKNIIGNVHAVEALDVSREGVREGKSLAAELAKSGIFPSMLSRMIAVGEKSGALEQMLNKAGSAYEKEVDASLEGLTSLLEPLLMIVVGVIVLAIVISVLLPMADLITLVG